jgi:quercetin dioxygenase-like cupin family protein
MTYFFDPETRTPKELVPGVVVRTFWGEQMLASLVDLAAGAVVPLHSHPHEQFGMLLRGEMQMTIAGETRTVQAGDLYFVPGGVEHGVHVGAAGAQAIEAFSPVREEYKFPD